MDHLNKQQFESGVPLGGMGCGKLELCADGAIRSVTTHNNIDQPFSDASGSNEYSSAGLRNAFAFVACEGDGAKILKYAEDTRFQVLPEDAIQFSGLYPRALLETKPFTDISVTLEAFSPLILNEGGDYKDSSLPCAVLLLRAVNQRAQAQRCTLGFSWPNVIGRGGYPGAKIADNRANETEHLERERYELLRFYHQYPKVDRRLDGEYALLLPKSENSEVSWSIASWDEALWQHFRSSGQLTNSYGQHGLGAAGAIAPGKTGMLCASRTLAPGETWELPIVLSWYFPNKPANLKPGVCYRNAYAKHFKSAEDVAVYAYDHRSALRAGTVAWQQRLQDSSLPEWLKIKLINNLFPISSCSMYLSDGRFSINEAPTYMQGCMGTIDQRSASATAYVMGFPEIAKSELAQFAAQQISEEQRERHGKHWNCSTGGYDLPLDRLGAIKHEIGWDELEEGKYGGEGWCNLHWPDLTSVFVLQCYQQITWTGDASFLEEVYPKLKRALAFQKRLDQNNDGIAELWGPGSSTFDNNHFPYFGASSYVGTLYLAALKAAMKLAEHKGEGSYVRELQADFAKAKETLETRLWDESKGYYISWHDPEYRNWSHTDRAHDETSENSMLASLAGEWYASMLDLGPLLEPSRVARALGQLYERNVKPVRYCAANEAKPDGSRSFSWPFYGEAYFAANAIYKGQVDRALEMLNKFYEAAFVKNRSPWNIPLMWIGDGNGEPEWGKWYMTNPSSWSVLLALTGIRYNALEEALDICPPAPRTELSKLPVFMPRFTGTLLTSEADIQLNIDRIIGTDVLTVRVLGVPEDASHDVQLNGTPVAVNATSSGKLSAHLQLKSGDKIRIARGTKK